MLIGVSIFNKMSCRHGTDPGISVLKMDRRIATSPNKEGIN
jgi:hypothetical protein